VSNQYQFDSESDLLVKILQTLQEDDPAVLAENRPSHLDKITMTMRKIVRTLQLTTVVPSEYRPDQFDSEQRLFIKWLQTLRS